MASSDLTSHVWQYTPSQWHCSTQQYLRMIETGVLGPADRVELIDGVITPMSPSGPAHTNAVMQLNELFSPLIGRMKLLVQGTVNLGDGQIFDPDFALLRIRNEGYAQRHAEPADILLIIEVADTSLQKDRQVKQRVYARSGIADYWIADLDRKAMIVHREPEGEAYNRIETSHVGQTVTPLAAPDLSLPVQQVFA